MRSPIRRIKGEIEESVEDHSSVLGSRGWVVVAMRVTRVLRNRHEKGREEEGNEIEYRGRHFVDLDTC